ncbi:sodium/glutamate symporter [Lonepinella koalarum]|uniref:sodium/glutamate symporter n=1 Tax=Lonepinella koalarum TaxID=53417 RepID=UPI003F6DC710
METTSVTISMFETLGLAVIAIYFGDWLRHIFPILRKYCLPASVVGGTIFSIISLLLYSTHIVELKFDYQTINQFFYCLFFAACGSAANVSLLKKGGKLIIIFAVLAALLAIMQNIISLGIGDMMNVNPLISLMTGSIPMTGGHGNAASFAPLAEEAGAIGAMEVAIASATFGLIVGCVLGGPFGNFIIKRHKLDTSSIKQTLNENLPTQAKRLYLNKSEVINAVFLLCIALGLGQVINSILKHYDVNFPIHVSCMFGGIIVRLLCDISTKDHKTLYEAMDTVGEFALGLFVSMSIITMKLWHLSNLGLALLCLLSAQVVLVLIFCYFLTFKLLGKNYDAAVMAVGHTGFSLGAVPVAMTTMQSVCKKYRYSSLAFFVVPVIGGFISNITNAVIITQFLSIAKHMLGIS